MGASAALVVLADQLTKDLAITHLANAPVHLFGSLWLWLAFNTGVAFSIGTGLTLPIILIGLTLVAAIAWIGRGIASTPGALAIGLVLGGAVSNLGDRLFRGRGGAVVDFIHLGFWPTFNLADSSIVIGCVLLVLVFWRQGTVGTHGSEAPRVEHHETDRASR